MRYLFTILITVVIFTAVLWPASGIPDTDMPIDKAVHFLLFVGWAVAFSFDFELKWYLTLFGGLLLAFLSEAVQIPIEGRSFDVNDLIADGAGVVFGLANAPFIIRIAKKILRRD